MNHKGCVALDRASIGKRPAPHTIVWMLGACLPILLTFSVTKYSY